MKLWRPLNICVLSLGFIVLLSLPGLAEELTRDNASKPIVFLSGTVSEKVKHQGKEYEVWLRELNTKNFIQKTHRVSGTGFIIGYKNKTYLVTAKHIAQKTSINWSATISGPNDTAVPFPFEDFSGYTNNLPWVPHPIADVAVLPLKNDSKYCKSGMLKQLDISVFVRTAIAPPREKILTILGFPLNLGVGKKISPLSKETKAASGLYDIQKDPNTVTVFFLSDPSIDGYSGSPVFAFPTEIAVGASSIKFGSRQTLCYGLVSATRSDRTGGKLAQVVPSSQVCETILRAHKHNEKLKR